MQKKGYIYVRTHYSYDNHNACKLGKTDNIPQRDSTYATGEIKRGIFELVFEVDEKNEDAIEKRLQTDFREHHIIIDGGREFFNKKILNLIEDRIYDYGFNYRKLSRDEIDNLTLPDRIRTQQKRDELELYHNQNTNIPKPREDQEIIINKCIEHWGHQEKGLLVLMCGVGKTLISLWMCQRMSFTKILVGVPNCLLLEQWRQVVSLIFPNIKCFMVSSGKKLSDIEKFIESSSSHIVITTYSSSHKVLNICQRNNYNFDIKILDEVHHLTDREAESEEDRKKYINILKIESTYQLGLTATLKNIENEGEHIVSNDNKIHFGDIIDKKCLYWAIKNNVVCDYEIQTIITDETQLEEKLKYFKNIETENDRRLFLSSFIALKSINEGHSHHLLVYSNNKENSCKIISYIAAILKSGWFDIPSSDLYYSAYHGDMRTITQTTILDKFKKSRIGIISCVYCLGEGWDLPLLDGVVFAENMTSNIRIVQSALRSCRRDKNNPDKKSKIILPMLNIDDWTDMSENSDFRKIKKVIYHMGLEDEMITEKIKLYRITVEPQCDKTIKKESISIGEYDQKLTDEILLKTVHRNILDITYEKAKRIILEKNIISKSQYFRECENDIRLNPQPDVYYKGKFKSWIDYLSIPLKYYNLQECRERVQYYLKNHPELQTYYLDMGFITKRLCEMDDNFPPEDLWVDYYGIKNLNEIIIFNYIKKKKTDISLT